MFCVVLPKTAELPVEEVAILRELLEDAGKRGEEEAREIRSAEPAIVVRSRWSSGVKDPVVEVLGGMNGEGVRRPSGWLLGRGRWSAGQFGSGARASLHGGGV